VVGQWGETRAGALEELLETTEGYCKSHRLGRERGGAAGLGGRPSGASEEKNLGGQLALDPKSKSHLTALSEYLAKIAAVERRVMNFRRRFLGAATRTLKPAEVPGILKSWSIRPGAEKEDDVFLYWTVEDKPAQFRGSHFSAIAELDRVGNYLARNYPWFKEQAMYFILCGEVAQAKTVSGAPRQSYSCGPPAHNFSRGTIALEIEAWMSPELVKKAYAKVQRELREDMQLAGADIRYGHERNAEIFRFVLDHSKVEVVSEAEGLGKLTLHENWRNLRRSWDDTLPVDSPWRYGEQGLRNFRRDFGRGQQAITDGTQGLPAIPGQPKTQSESRAYFAQFLERWGVRSEKTRNT